MVGSLAVPLPLARSMSNFDPAPSRPPDEPPPSRWRRLCPDVDTKSPARRSSCPATVPGSTTPAAADPRVVGDASVVDEHLVEQCVTGQLTQRAHVDTGLVHVEREPRDALMLRYLGIRASDQHAEIGVLAARRPHLLTVDD